MNGVLLMDKPAGMTSHDVVARVRKIIGERRVGHTGTLDPFATGLLVILVGPATRLAQFLSGAEKEYEGLIRFGYTTDTGDVTGSRVECEAHRGQTPSAESLRQEEIQAAITSLTGEIQQVPPMYSAKKIQGKKLYEFARGGHEVERQPVRVMIRKLEMLSPAGELLRANDDGSVDLRVRVVCSAGTYIRTLAEDLGKKLGMGAHLIELRRTRAGRFGIEKATTLDELTELAAANSVVGVLISPNDAAAHLSQIEVDQEDKRRIAHGIDLRISGAQADSWHDGDAVRLTQDGKLLGMGIFDASLGILHPAVVLETD